MRGNSARTAVLTAATGAVLLAVTVVGLGDSELTGSASDGEPDIVVGTTRPVGSLDPAAGSDPGSWALFSNVFQSLLTLVPGSDEPVPDAARSCDFTDDTLLTYRCVLHSGLEFSNGRELTAQDVRFSIERIRAIDAPGAPTWLFETLESVRTKGRTVVFELNTPDAVLPYKLASPAASIVDRERYRRTALRTDGGVDGSGAFVLGEYQEGSRIRLEPNPTYRSAVPAAASAVTIRLFDDPEQLAAAWDNGELDVSDGRLPPAAIDALPPGDRSVEIGRSAGARIRALVFNTRAGFPGSRRAVRQAAAWLINRDALARGAHYRLVEPLYSLVPRNVAGHGAPFQEVYPQPRWDRAAELLRETGARLPVGLTLAHTADAGAAREARLLARQLADSGLFEVTVSEQPRDAFRRGIARGEFDAYTVGWSPEYPDPETYTRPLVGSPGVLHHAYRNPAIDALIRDTRRQQDRTAAGEHFRTIHQLVARDAPVIPLWEQQEYTLSSRRITGAHYVSDYASLWALWQLTRN